MEVFPWRSVSEVQEKMVSPDRPATESRRSAPDFECVTGLDIQTLAFHAEEARLFSWVPSLDTPVCSQQPKSTKRSVPSGQGRLLHHSLRSAFARAVLPRTRRSQHEEPVRRSHHPSQELRRPHRGLTSCRGHLRRGQEHKIILLEYVPDVPQHPNYDSALAALKAATAAVGIAPFGAVHSTAANEITIHAIFTYASTPRCRCLPERRLTIATSTACIGLKRCSTSCRAGRAPRLFLDCRHLDPHPSQLLASRARGAVSVERTAALPLSTCRARPRPHTPCPASLNRHSEFFEGSSSRTATKALVEGFNFGFGKGRRDPTCCREFCLERTCILHWCRRARCRAAVSSAGCAPSC